MTDDDELVRHTASAEADVQTTQARSRPVLGMLRAGWRTAGREFMLIVAGVLTALAAQAWWEGRQERVSEQQYLEALRMDVVETERRLLEALAQERAAEHSTHSLIAALQSGEPLPFDSVRAWLTPPRWIFWYSDPRLVMSTVGSLHETGDLKLIRTEGLRQAITGYAHEMSGEWTEFGRWIEQDIRALTLFEERGSRVVPRYPYTRQREDTGTRGALFVAALQNDPDLRGILLAVETARRNRVFYLERMRDSSRRLQAVLERD